MNDILSFQNFMFVASFRETRNFTYLISKNKIFGLRQNFNFVSNFDELGCILLHT